MEESKKERCRHFAARIDEKTGLNTSRQCTGIRGHAGEHGWTRGGEASWLPDAPNAVQQAFADAIRGRTT